MSDLKACPFCGDQPRWHPETGPTGEPVKNLGAYQCDGDGHEIDTGDWAPEPEARARWNRRASPWRTDMDAAPRDGRPVDLVAVHPDHMPQRYANAKWSRCDGDIWVDMFHETIERNGWRVVAWMGIPPYEGGGDE